VNRFWFLIGAVIIGQIAAWTFVPHEPVQHPSASGDPRSNPNEKYAVDSRAGQRQGATAALDGPYGARCAGEGRKKFISEINQYYDDRQNQLERYSEIYGKAGADYIVEQWSTPEDKRIERLTQEAYSQGYLKPSDFGDEARKMIEVIVRDERVVAKACES
jgi:hypothetical protein